MYFRKETLTILLGWIKPMEKVFDLEMWWTVCYLQYYTEVKGCNMV